MSIKVKEKFVSLIILLGISEVCAAFLQFSLLVSVRVSSNKEAN